MESSGYVGKRRGENKGLGTLGEKKDLNQENLHKRYAVLKKMALAAVWKEIGLEGFSSKVEIVNGKGLDLFW